MPVNIRALKSLVPDFARPTKYWVSIGVPKIMQSNSLSVRMKDIELMCSAASFPGLQFSTSETRLKGPMRKIPYDQIYNDLSLTFYNSSVFLEREYFSTWANSIFDQETKNFEFYEDYISSITILQFANSGDYVYGVELEEAYPVDLGQIDLGYDQTDAIETFTVQFAYRTWKQIEIDSLESFATALIPVVASESGLIKTITSPFKIFDKI